MSKRAGYFKDDEEESNGAAKLMRRGGPAEEEEVNSDDVEEADDDDAPSFRTLSGSGGSINTSIGLLAESIVDSWRSDDMLGGIAGGSGGSGGIGGDGVGAGVGVDGVEPDPDMMAQYEDHLTLPSLLWPPAPPPLPDDVAEFLQDTSAQPPPLPTSADPPLSSPTRPPAEDDDLDEDDLEDDEDLMNTPNPPHNSSPLSQPSERVPVADDGLDSNPPKALLKSDEDQEKDDVDEDGDYDDDDDDDMWESACKMLEELPDGLAPVKEAMPMHKSIKTKTFLIEKGKNHFDLLPEGWICAKHSSGMPVYLHRRTRVVSLSKPYSIGPGSVRNHRIPLSSIPCLHYQRAKEGEEKLKAKMRANDNSSGCQGAEAGETQEESSAALSSIARNNEGQQLQSKNAATYQARSANFFPEAKISTLSEARMTQSLTSDEFKGYCKRLFEFREVKVKTFKNWKEKRIYHRMCQEKLTDEKVKKALMMSSMNGKSLGGAPDAAPVSGDPQAAGVDQPKPPTCPVKAISKGGPRVHNLESLSENPSLPDGLKLITIPVLEMQKNNDNLQNGSEFNTKIVKKTKKNWIFNPKGKSYVCILHEYLQHSIKKTPEYTYAETDSVSTPYSATVIIDDVQYGKGVGASKKQAKSEAARTTLEVLIPQFKESLGQDVACKAKAASEPEDLSFFDNLRVEDARITELCQKIGEPSPFAMLTTCLQKNYGLGDTKIETSLVPKRNKRNEFIMKVNNREVSVICKNKRDGKQFAAQKVLQLLHPHVTSWGGLLRLYGSRAIHEEEVKKQQESDVTSLQTKQPKGPDGVGSTPSQSILDSLKEEMLKLSEAKKNALPIGKLTLPGTFPGSNYGKPAVVVAPINL